jgi:hypothetical protein
VDRAAPVRDLAILTHGQVIEALVANRLTSPRPLWRVSEWAWVWAVDEVFDIGADALNDDRIGRALDAIAPHLDQIVGSVGARAIGVFGLDVAQLHWDMTSISLYGAYAEGDEEFARPRFGHPKDRRPDLKQIQTGLAVTGDGSVPVLHHAYDGGAGEVAQVVGAMTALQQMAGPRRFLLVGDSKLVSYRNLRAMLDAGGRVHRPSIQDLPRHQDPRRPGPGRRHRGRLRGAARRRQAGRCAGPVAGLPGHHHHPGSPQT